MVGRAHVHDPQIWEDAGNVRVRSHVSFWAQHTELSGHRAMGRGRKGESAEHQVDPGSSQHIGSGGWGPPIPDSEGSLGNTDLAGHVLRLRAEVLRHFPAARGEVQDGGGGHVGSLSVVCVIEACGRGCSAGAVPGGRGLWERFGCKKGTTPGCYRGGPGRSHADTWGLQDGWES